MLDFHRLVREFVAQNNSTQIRHVIQILASEFALSQHPHSRKGGLIGLAACSIALGKVREECVCFVIWARFVLSPSFNLVVAEMCERPHPINV